MLYRKFILIILFVMTTFSFQASNSVAHIAPIFNIIPSLTNTILRSDGLTEVIFTATNMTPKQLSHIIIDPTFNTTGNKSAITVQNNNCNNLSPGASCTFQVLIRGTGQPTSFQISPRICAFNGAACSQPIAAYRLNVQVATISGNIFAYVGLTNTNQLQSIDANHFTLGNPLGGFSFNNAFFNGIVVAHSGKKVYVCNDNVNTVSVVNGGATPSIAATIDVDSFPTGIAITPDDAKIYVTNYFSNNVSVINTQNNTVISTIDTGGNPTGIVISPDGSKAYVTSPTTNSVFVIDTHSNSLITSIPVGSGPAGLCITPDGAKVYVGNQSSNNISVINTANNTVITTITSGSFGPIQGLTSSPDGTKVFAVTGNQNVAVINTSNDTVTTSIALGGSPIGIASTPKGDALFVSNVSSGFHSVTVINTSNFTTTNINVGGEQTTFGNFVG